MIKRDTTRGGAVVARRAQKQYILHIGLHPE